MSQGRGGRVNGQAGEDRGGVHEDDVARRLEAGDPDGEHLASARRAPGAADSKAKSREALTVKIGLQLYTLRDALAENFRVGLRRVSALGYQGVEFAGYGGLEAEELGMLTRALGLSPVSSHVSIDQLDAHLADELDYAVTAGLAHVVCPWLPAARRANAGEYRATARLLNEIGVACQARGLQFGYHNHAVELETQVGNVPALEFLLAETDPALVNIEFDVYWIQYAGMSPSDWIQRYAGRCPLLHIKDMDPNDRSFREVGQGSLDMKAIVAAARTADSSWLFVEQDECRQNPWVSVTQSLAYLQALAGGAPEP